MQKGGIGMSKKCKSSEVECLEGMAQSELCFQEMAKSKTCSPCKSAVIRQFKKRPAKVTQSAHARRVAPLAMATGR